mgnify:CR=1 FL=1
MKLCMNARIPQQFTEDIVKKAAEFYCSESVESLDRSREMPVFALPLSRAKATELVTPTLQQKKDRPKIVHIKSLDGERLISKFPARKILFYPSMQTKHTDPMRLHPLVHTPLFH